MKQFSFLFLFVTVSFFSACSLDEPTVGPVFIPIPTFELINQTDDFSLLSVALNRSGLDSALVGANAFTLFAPTDAAWAASGIDVETIDSTELNDLLRYHILLNLVLTTDTYQNSQLYLNTANIKSPDASAVMLFLDGASNLAIINNESTIIGEQLIGTNAIIHPIDVVLRPPTVIDMLEANPSLSLMAGLFNDAAPFDNGTLLTDSLQRPGTFTLLAAINTNFPTGLSLSPEETRSVALYSVVSNRNFRFDNFPSSFTTFQGDEVNIFGSSVVTSSAQSLDVQFTDIQGTNGILHLVSGLMLPEGL